MTNPPTNSPKRARSTSYPSISLDKAIQNVESVKKNLGKGPFSRESVAKALGYRGISGKSGTVISALVYYGLLTRKANTYSVSPLTDQILTFKDEAEKTTAILKAASHPKLYAQLLQTYGGKGLPGMLSHILARDYGINEAVAADVAQTFEVSMSFAGLLVNGILKPLDEETPTSPDTDGESHTPDVRSSGPSSTRSTHGYYRGIANDNQVHQVDIADGIVLAYRADLAFQLFTNPDFATALQSLKQAVESSEAHSESDQGDNGEG